VESLLIHLLLSKYLREDFQATAYSVNVYIIPGPQSLRLSRLSRADVEGGKCPKIGASFLRKMGKRKGLSKSKIGGKGGMQTTLDSMQGVADDVSETQQTSLQRVSMKPRHRLRTTTRTTKRKRIATSDNDDEGDLDSDDDITSFVVEDGGLDDFGVGGSAADNYTSGSGDDEWSHSLTKNHSHDNEPPNKRRRVARPNVIELSD